MIVMNSAPRVHDREMKTHLLGDQGQNYKIWLILRKMVGNSAESFSRPIVHVERKCLIGSGSAEHCHSCATLLILLGVRYNSGARAVHLIGMGWYQGCQKRTVCRISCYLMHDARLVPCEVRTLNYWRTKKRWQLSASERWVKITDGKVVHQNERSDIQGSWLSSEN